MKMIKETIARCDLGITKERSEAFDRIKQLIEGIEE